jgi:transposase
VRWSGKSGHKFKLNLCYYGDQESTNPPRKYDSAFKEQALNQVENGRSVSSVSKALGISEALLYQWRKRALSSVSNSNVGAEVEALRRQIKQLEVERDILKKALAIFSRPI